MKNRKIIPNLFILILIIGTIYLNSCSDDSNPAGPQPPNTTGLIRLDSAFMTGARTSVSFYVEDSLAVGYNKVYLILYDSITKALITDAHIEFLPTGHGGVGAPVENPPSNAVDGKFAGAIILTAPQNDNVLHWHFNFRIHNHQSPGEPEGEIEFEGFTVRDDPNKFKSFTMPDSTKLYLAYIRPENPVTGLNDFEFVIRKNEPDLFPPEGTYTIEMRPEFLDDGHTTNNNINPVGSANGHYNGRVNFDRTGAWRIKISIRRNIMSYDTYFDVTF